MDTIILDLEATWARIKLLKLQIAGEYASFDADTQRLHSTVQDILLERAAAAHGCPSESTDMEYLAELDSIVDDIVNAVISQ